MAGSSSRKKRHEFRDRGRQQARRKLLRRWDGPFLEHLEDRLVLASLNPALEPAIVNGLNSVAAYADNLDQLDKFASTLPVVGQSIGQVLDFGKQFRDELLTPVQNYLAANDPTDSAQLVSGLNSILSMAGSPVVLSDASTAGVFKVRVKNFSFSETERNLPIDLGPAAGTSNLDLGARLDFTPRVDFGIEGDVGFAFGLDLDPAKSPAEAFFIDLTDTVLQFSVETPFAGQGTPAPLDFELDLGMLGDVKVTGGSIDLDANLKVSFPDTVLTAQELAGSPISSLVAVAGSGGLNVNLPISAKLAGTDVGSAKIAVTLAGDVFGDPQVNVNIEAETSDIAQAFKNFRNISPGDVVSTLSELATDLQALATSFNLPAGIPFVEQKISDVLDFTGRLEGLTKSHFDLGLQGGTEFLASALGSNAQFSVVIDGVTKVINVAGGTTLANLAATVQGQLPAGLEAVIEGGRLAIRATNDAIQSLKFAGVDPAAQAAFGFANTQSAIPSTTSSRSRTCRPASTNICPDRSRSPTTRRRNRSGLTSTSSGRSIATSSWVSTRSSTSGSRSSRSPARGMRPSTPPPGSSSRPRSTWPR